MNTRELRIGNLVKYQRNTIIEDITSIVGIMQDCVMVLEENQDGACYPKSLDKIKPILMNKEWELYFGLDKQELGMTVLADIGWGILMSYDDEDQCYIVCARDEYQIATFKYVHQFQNLYFALAGKDITGK